MNIYICIDTVVLQKNIPKSKTLNIIRRINNEIQPTSWLKLERTYLNYLVLETSTADIFFEIIILSMYRGWMSYLIIFVWDQSTCQERVESDKIQNEKISAHSGTRTNNL